MLAQLVAFSAAAAVPAADGEYHTVCLAVCEPADKICGDGKVSCYASLLHFPFAVHTSLATSVGITTVKRTTCIPTAAFPSRGTTRISPSGCIGSSPLISLPYIQPPTFPGDVSRVAHRSLLLHQKSRFAPKLHNFLLKARYGAHFLSVARPSCAALFFPPPLPFRACWLWSAQRDQSSAGA